MGNKYGSNIIPALVNVKGKENINTIRNLIFKDSKLASSNSEEFNKLSINEIEEFLQSENNDTNKSLEDYLKESGVTGRQLENKVVEVFEPSQITILNSSETISKIREIINKKNGIINKRAI